MTNVRQLIAIAAIALMATAQGQKREPRIGYLYPAGGQQGTTVKITVGGQSLFGATQIHISGEGVTGKVIRKMKPIMLLKAEQRVVTLRKMLEVRAKRLKELGVPSAAIATMNRKIRTPKNLKEEDIAKTKLPNHILLDDIENKSLRELMHIRNIIFFPRKMVQQNRQIAELLLIELKIAPDAAPGTRELRIQSKTGLTNPMAVKVGQLPEVYELEPNDKGPNPEIPIAPKLARKIAMKPLKLPVLLNGQILPGDVDRFEFTAQKGQQLVIKTEARSLIPYLADAVPGWFQATVALYDDKGKEIAYADDYRFNPDPVLLYKIPRTGTYQIEIRDAIYRGREDFVYRIAIGELPFITRTFPLGAKAGSNTKAEIAGWNITKSSLALNTSPTPDWIRYFTDTEGGKVSNRIPYAIDELPEGTEAEPNNKIATAQTVVLPVIINGRIGKPGDVDVFKLEAKETQTIIAEVVGRRLNSPIDSLIRITDSSGKVIAWNDDYVQKIKHLYTNREGLETHHADSHTQARLPGPGFYYVHVSDVQQSGSEAHAYRLRIAPPKPDFLLRVTPSSLYANRGGMVPVTVYVSRKDGFNGKVRLKLKGAPSGFRIQGGTIPANANRVRLMLFTSMKELNEPLPLRFEGEAEIDGREVVRTAMPADDVMQAFLYRHLVPAEQTLLAIRNSKWPMPPIRLGNRWPVPVPIGGSVRIQMRTMPRKFINEFKLVLDSPPKGITLDGFKATRTGFEFNIKAAKDMKPGLAENLIVEIYREFMQKKKGNKPARKSSWPIGYLPAIPIEIVEK